MTPLATLLLGYGAASFSAHGVGGWAAQRSHLTRAASASPILSASDDSWANVCSAIDAPKLSVREPLAEERGKGGVFAAAPIAAMEIVARIPRTLIISSDDLSDTWAQSLTGDGG